MRTIAALLLLMAASACRQEPDFDQRYADAQRKLEARSAEIERDLSKASPPAQAPEEPDTFSPQ